MSWYKEWFNSENYLKVYSHRDEAEAERLVELIEKETNLNSGTSILDMACGAGRHSIAFAKRGYTVTAVDLSQRLLAEAKKNATIAGVNINFILSDVLEFDSEQKFDLAVNLFTSIGYFKDDDENYSVIAKSYKLLNEGGYFVLDYFNKNYLIKNLIPTSVISENGLKITQNRSVLGDRVEKKITIEKDNSINNFYESVRLYSYEEMKKMIMKAGLRVVKETGDFYGNSYEKETSPRLILFAKK